jgi:hypothetical protein
MTRWLLAGGSCTLLMGLASIVPVAAAYAEDRPSWGVEVPLLAASGVLCVGGIVAIVLGAWQRRGTSMPGSVRAAVMANILFLAFCALELSDRLVRQEGRIFYWTTVLFLPALILFHGLVSARVWAWWTSRGLAALACLWFIAFIALIPFADLRADGVPAPWYGRVYMACVTLVFAAISAAAFWSLGRSDARGYFQRVPREEIRMQASRDA